MNGIDEKGFPDQEGVYLARYIWGSYDAKEIDVYLAGPKGLSCFQEDFGSAGTGIGDENDCHVSVQCTGLEFIARVRSLE